MKDAGGARYREVEAVTSSSAACGATRVWGRSGRFGVGAVISGDFQMAAFIRLRRLLPTIARPYRSPLGVPGAGLALALSALTLYTLGLAWFAVVGRRRLVLSPEERFAVAARSEAKRSGVH